MKLKHVLLLVAAWWVIGRAEAQDSSAKRYQIIITGSVGRTVSSFESLLHDHFAGGDTTPGSCYGIYVKLQATVLLTDANMGLDILVRAVQYSPASFSRVATYSYGTF